MGTNDSSARFFVTFWPIVHNIFVCWKFPLTMASVRMSRHPMLRTTPPSFHLDAESCRVVFPTVTAGTRRRRWIYFYAGNVVSHYIWRRRRRRRRWNRAEDEAIVTVVILLLFLDGGWVARSCRDGHRSSACAIYEKARHWKTKEKKTGKRKK